MMAKSLIINDLEENINKSFISTQKEYRIKININT